MYRYDEFDTTFVRQRVDQFRDQVNRRVAGDLTEEQFRPLRLMNGLYLQLHAYMLRVAIPYGTLNARQMRQLAFIADQYDKGYGHFTTRQNIQFNWPKLADVPDILDRPGRCRDARHPDQRQLHPQRHRRPVRRRRRGRDRRSAPLRGADAPMVEPAPGILLPAAQVQDRGHRRRCRPRGHQACTTSALDLKRNATAKPDSRSWSAAAWAARPWSRQDGPRLACRKDDLLAYLEAIMRVYNLHRPARQQVQGADQDPRP